MSATHVKSACIHGIDRGTAQCQAFPFAFSSWLVRAPEQRIRAASAGNQQVPGLNQRSRHGSQDQRKGIQAGNVECDRNPVPLFLSWLPGSISTAGAWDTYTLDLP